MKDKINNWLRTILMVVVSAIVGYIALILVFILPIEPIRENVGASLDMLKYEGISHNIIDGYDTTRLDNYTEGLTFNSAIFDSSDSVFEKAASIHQYRYKNAEMYYDALFEFYSGNTEYYIDEYARDWHGYLVFTKLALLLFDYSDIRVLNLIVQMMLMIVVCICIYEDDKAKPYLGAFCVLLLLISAPMMFMSMEYSALFYLILISIIYILCDKTKLSDDRRRCLFFALIGIGVAYVDVLTYPLLTFGVPAVFWYIECNGNKESRKTIILLCENFFHWLTGYAGMWGMKWIIATLFTEKNIIKDAILMVLYRMSSTSAESGEYVSISVSEVLNRNLSVYAHGPYILIFLIVILFVIYNIYKKNLQVNRTGILFYGILFVMPFVWLIGVKNHSYIHYWMTYRNVALAVFSILCFLIECRNNKQHA